MEKKEEQNYIRQLLLELEDYLFSLSWYDGEDRLKTFRDVSNIKSIFQLVPQRYLKLLEGRIYTQEELDKAREEGFTEEELKMIYLALCDHEQKLVFTPEGKEFYDNLYSKVNRMLGFKFESKLKTIRDMEETKELKKRFEARGLSVEIKTKGVVEEEVVHLFNILTREVNRFMQEEVMQRRSEELSKLKSKE